MPSAEASNPWTCNSWKGRSCRPIFIVLLHGTKSFGTKISLVDEFNTILLVNCEEGIMQQYFYLVNFLWIF
jgi:hypothetical protein